MFNTKKTDQFPSNPGGIGAIFATIIGVYVLVSLFSSGNLLYVVGGCLVLFAGWWVYTRFFSKQPNNELAKYQKAVRKQKKVAATEEKGKVIYLDRRKRR